MWFLGFEVQPVKQVTVLLHRNLAFVHRVNEVEIAHGLFVCLAVKRGAVVVDEALGSFLYSRPIFFMCHELFVS